MNFFKNLFSPQKENSNHDDTIVPATQARKKYLTPHPGIGFYVGQNTDIGKHREQNQDSIYTFQSFMETNKGREPFGIFIVADGMGGYQKGDIASEIAAKTAVGYLTETIFLPTLSLDNHVTMPPLNEAMVNAVIAANKAVVKEVPEAGTTLTMAVIIGQQAYFAHVGDSRAYIFHKGELNQITQDHSLVARLVELGQATAEEALTHPQRNVLYRAVGQTDALEVDTYIHNLPDDGFLMMCSDGLWGMVRDDEITRILSTATSPDDAAAKLVDTANANGGDDNISVLLIGLGI